MTLLGVSLTGCPTGSALDTPHEEYVPEAAEIVTGNGPSSVTSSTTSGRVPCDDTNVNDGGLAYWCGGCHGSEGQDNGTAPLWLFSPTRSTDFLNRAAVTQGCTAELIVDTANPEASLLFSSLRGTSPCGVKMPKNLVIDIPAHQVCIEEWALGLAGDGG
ncbi:MAG TPA: hypothetical protein VFU02_23310 [Polyangiaceae bacterium]|nr:hypothetical protein [Polyangiaceae bacterium]